MLSTAENVHFDTAISCRREPFENDRIDVFGMLDIQPFGRRVDELRHVITRIGIAPQQAFIVAVGPIAMLPVGVEYFDDLRDVVGVVGDDAVVTGKREVLFHEVEGRDERGFLVDHNRLLVRHVELGIGPLDRDAGALELLIRLVICPITPVPSGIELHPHVDAGFLPVDDGRDQTRFGKRELLD